MPVYFVDSSALVKRYRYEVGSERVTALLNPAERLIIARLTHVEVCAAIVRRARSTQLGAADLAAVLATLDVDLTQSFDIVELDAPVLERAVEITRKHGLRAADAIQLACALLARGEIAPTDYVVVTSDQELKTAAAAEGLNVVDPTQP